MDAFYRQKGVEHALDHMCDSLNSVVAGISEWLHDGWVIHILLVVAIIVVVIQIIQGHG